MNSIKQKIAEIKNQNKVPIRVGSHQVYVQVEKFTTGLELLAKALERCKIHNFHSYDLYENVCGIERVVRKDSFVIDYILQWPKVENCCFVIRKCISSSKVIQSIERSKIIRAKLFEISKQMASSQMTLDTQDEHIYEDVRDLSISKVQKMSSKDKVIKFNKLKLKNNFRKLFKDLKNKSKNVTAQIGDSSQLINILSEFNFDSTI